LNIYLLWYRIPHGCSCSSMVFSSKYPMSILVLQTLHWILLSSWFVFNNIIFCLFCMHIQILFIRWIMLWKERFNCCFIHRFRENILKISINRYVFKNYSSLQQFNLSPLCILCQVKCGILVSQMWLFPLNQELLSLQDLHNTEKVTCENIKEWS
jgi:hypothetical protein